MKARRTLDVSALPTYAFGHRDPMWWGLALLLAIEGTTVALLLATWFYIHMTQPSGFPGTRLELPLGWATAGTVLLLLSAIPNHLLNGYAEKESLKGVRFWLIVTTAFAVAFLVCRGFELSSVNFKWDAHAYGSTYWALLGLNIFHALGAVLENFVFIVLLFKGPVEKKLMPDLKLDGNYWYFVIASWTVIYAVIYLAPFIGQ